MAGFFGIAKRGLGMLGKKKPRPTAKPRSKPQERFVDKDPFERGAIISRRESAKRGDVYTGTSVVGTPHSKRSAKAIRKYSGPHSYQLTDPKRRGPHAKGGRIGFKRAGPVTKADLARSDLWRKRELKRRAKIGQRKSRWDIKGGISGHPLNPLRIHAAGKATDWSSKRKDVYNRTRDDLKKSRDSDVKRVAENFQKMDWKDEARNDPRYEKGTKYYEEHSPKLIKRTHGRLGKKTGGRIGLQFGGPPSRSDEATHKQDRRHQRQLERIQYKKEAQKRKEARDVRDVKGNIISREGKPHSTYAGRSAERRTGYLRKNKMLPGMRNDPKRRIQIKPKMSAEQRKLRDNLASVTGGEWGKKRGGKV